MSLQPPEPGSRHVSRRTPQKGGGKATTGPSGGRDPGERRARLSPVPRLPAYPAGQKTDPLQKTHRDVSIYERSSEETRRQLRSLPAVRGGEAGGKGCGQPAGRPRSPRTAQRGAGGAPTSQPAAREGLSPQSSAIAARGHSHLHQGAG